MPPSFGIWLTLATALLQDSGPSQVQGAQTLAEYARSCTSRQAMGVYMADKKVGWSVIDLRMEKRDGHPCLRVTEEIRMGVVLAGESSTIEESTCTWYSLEGAGPIVRIEERTVEDDQVTERVAYPDGDGFVVKTRTAGEEVTRQATRPRDNLAHEREIDRWLGSLPGKGATLDTWSVDLEKREIDSKEVLTFLGERHLPIGGVSTPVFEVRMTVDGMEATAQLLDPKVFLKITAVDGVMEFRAEDEPVAKNLEAVLPDVTWILSIPVEKDLGDDPGRIEALDLEVGGLGDFELPADHRQAVERRSGVPSVVSLRRDRRLDEGRPLGTEERARWLESEPGIESDHETVKSRAVEIVGKETHPLKVANLLQHWIFENLEKTGARNASSAVAILANRAGDCSEHALLFVALARAAGLPAREVTGLLYGKLDRPMFAWHAWAEFHDGRQWISVDPAWDQVFVDASHVRFATGREDLAWVNVAAGIRIRVKGFETK